MHPINEGQNKECSENNFFAPSMLLITIDTSSNSAQSLVKKKSGLSACHSKELEKDIWLYFFLITQFINAPINKGSLTNRKEKNTMLKPESNKKNEGIVCFKIPK